jgi:hypothetical protein
MFVVGRRLVECSRPGRWARAVTTSSRPVRETCGAHASVHVTRGPPGAPVEHHFFQRHAPPELAELTPQHRRRAAEEDFLQKVEQAIACYHARDMDPGKKERLIAALCKTLARYRSEQRPDDPAQ